MLCHRCALAVLCILRSGSTAQQRLGDDYLWHCISEEESIVFRFGFVLMLLSTFLASYPGREQRIEEVDHPRAAQDLLEGTYPKHSISVFSGLSPKKTQKIEGLLFLGRGSAFPRTGLKL